MWLVGVGDGDPRHLSPLAADALSIADAVIHDPGIDGRILDLVKPPRYREAAEPCRAIERVAKLAQDGWRVVHLVRGNSMERAVEGARSVIDRHMPYRIVPTSGGPLNDETLFQAMSDSRTEHNDDPLPAFILLAPAPQEEAETEARPPSSLVDFSMTGLAG